jgi:hypothetical protein
MTPVTTTPEASRRRFLLWILFFLALVVLGIWLGDFSETWRNASTL